MPEADMSMTQMAMDPSNTEDKCFAQFYKHARQNKAKTLEEGRPIFDDLDYICIMVPGDKDNIVRRPVRATDERRFPKQWDAFKRGQEQAQDGTPLEEWPLLTRGQVQELKYFGCHTIEALAAMPDSAAQNFMGLNKLKQQAKDRVAAAKSDAPVLALREENDELRENQTMMQQQIDELIAANKKPRKAKE